MSFVDYNKYILSKEWAAVRNDVMLSARGKCERCDKEGTQVHHLTYANLGNEETEDLILLCSYHHMLEHGLVKERKAKRPRRKSARKSRKKKIQPEGCFVCNNPFQGKMVMLNEREHGCTGTVHKKCARVVKVSAVKKGRPPKTIIR